MVSAKSPWALDATVLTPATHLIPVSHGEGRVILPEALARDLFANGQVFTQYVGEDGVPTMREPDNPNGSMYAIEGLTSPDGRVLGKMGHNERAIGIDSLTGERDGSSRSLLTNIVRAADAGRESTCQNIFAAGVSYFG